MVRTQVPFTSFISASNSILETARFSIALRPSICFAKQNMIGEKNSKKKIPLAKRAASLLPFFGGKLLRHSLLLKHLKIVKLSQKSASEASNQKMRTLPAVSELSSSRFLCIKQVHLIYSKHLDPSKILKLLRHRNGATGRGDPDMLQIPPRDFLSHHLSSHVFVFQRLHPKNHHIAPEGK